MGADRGSLRSDRQLRALLKGLPHAPGRLTEEEVAWLGVWVPQGEVQHLQDSYGYRCGMDRDEGVKLYDVRTEETIQKVAGMEWEVWDSTAGSAARVAVECNTTDIVSAAEVAWVAEQIEKVEDRKRVRKQQGPWQVG